MKVHPVNVGEASQMQSIPPASPVDVLDVNSQSVKVGEARSTCTAPPCPELLPVNTQPVKLEVES